MSAVAVAIEQSIRLDVERIVTARDWAELDWLSASHVLNLGKAGEYVERCGNAFRARTAELRDAQAGAR